jgi:hypothetical protein
MAQVLLLCAVYRRHTPTPCHWHCSCPAHLAPVTYTLAHLGLHGGLGLDGLVQGRSCRQAIKPKRHLYSTRAGVIYISWQTYTGKNGSGAAAVCRVPLSIGARMAVLVGCG